MLSRLRHIIIGLILLQGFIKTAAQIAMPDTLCAGTTRTYSVNNPSVPSTYTWKIDGVVQSTTTNAITITWSTPGTFLLTVQEHATNGCDGDIQSGTVYVNPNVVPTFTPIGVLCQNSSPPTLPSISNNGIAGVWNPATINTSASGTTVYNFTPNSGQCATTTSLSITISPTLTDTTNASVCANQLPYIWNGNAYTAAGIYHDTLTSNTGCDTIATLILQIQIVDFVTTNATVCINELPYIWLGNAYFTAGTYVDTLPSSTGCDTVVTLFLQVAPLLTQTINASVCINQLPYIWNGNAYNAAGTYVDTLTSNNGCDTIATLNLVVGPMITQTTNATVCINQLPYIWNGNAYNASGTYVDTLPSGNGCDTLATLNLVVGSLFTQTTYASVCANQLPYIWNGNAYTASGIYHDTLTSGNSCDTLATLYLSIIIIDYIQTNVTVCANQLPYVWNGFAYYTPGTYIDTFTSTNGCDSILILNLAVAPLLTQTTNATVCANQLPYIWNGNAYNTAGTYVDTLSSGTGCDTVATLNLVIGSFLTQTTNATVCANQLPYIWNGNAYNTAGTYVDTLPSGNGCDTIATLNLVVGPLLLQTTNATVCVNLLPYIWNGNAYSTAGTYVDTLLSSNGCDTIATLNLTINSLPTQTISATICANQLPYIWGGNSYNNAGTYIDTLTSGNDCDTIVTLNLVVGSLFTQTTNATVCANQLPYIWKGNAYNSAGTYIDTLTSGNGCDTIATLNLAVNSLFTKTTNATICTNQLPYNWNGNNYNTTGIYFDTISANTGCDTITRLNLTVTPKPQAVRYTTITTNANTATQLLARSIGTSNQYQWSPATGLNFTSVINPVFNYDKTTQYLVTIVSDGCSVTDTLLVKVLPVATAEDVFVPTAWSPNNDGHNDKLIPLTKNIRSITYFKVFNRWGELVFQTNNIGEGWDGVYKNKPQVMDTYTWTVEGVGNSGKIIKRSGNSVLLR